jgi:hypothetical protein
MKWQPADGDWTRFRTLPELEELDLHRSGDPYEGSYWDLMSALADEVLNRLKQAQARGTKHLLVTHGRSTSEGWKHTTGRSVVRQVMRSPAATPYIVRRNCVQHESVFVAAIRQLPTSG